MVEFRQAALELGNGNNWQKHNAAIRVKVQPELTAWASMRVFPSFFGNRDLILAAHRDLVLAAESVNHRNAPSLYILAKSKAGYVRS